jgi:hypothetical protein
MQGLPVELPPALASLASQHGLAARAYRLEYAPGQRLAYVHEGVWREAVVLAPPEEGVTHRLAIHSGRDRVERQVDLTMHSHSVVPLYAYDVGHPLEILESRGHWKECVVVNRAPGCNQYVVRMGPTGHPFWTLLVPWNHRTLSSHSFVPLFAVRSLVPSRWTDDASLEGIGGDADDGAGRDRADEDELDETASMQIERDIGVEFVLNIRSAQRGRAVSLWCPGKVVAIHKRQFGTAVLKPGLGIMGKTCDVIAGAYRFCARWKNEHEPLLVRRRIRSALVDEASSITVSSISSSSALVDEASASLALGAEGADADGVAALAVRHDSGLEQGAGGVDSSSLSDSPELFRVGTGSSSSGSSRSSVGGIGRPGSNVLGSTGAVSNVAAGAASAANATAAGAAEGAAAAANAIDSTKPDDAPVADEGGEGTRAQPTAWGPWVRAAVEGDSLRMHDGEGSAFRWEHCMDIEVDVLPVYMYPPHAQLRVLRADGWCRMSAGERHPTLPNVYTGVFEDGERLSLTLTRSNHAPVLDPSVDMGPEHLKYVAWVRSTFSFVVDALSGERLDIVLQCVKLRVEGGAPGQQRDPFDVVMDEVASGDAQSKPVLVTGEAASGKSTFARLFMVKCLHQRPELQLVPFLLTTIDLMRIIKQNSLAGDYLDGFLRSVYGPRSRRYLFLKQAMLERRLVLFLDGMDEVPTGLKSVVEAHIMTAVRMSARVVMTSRPGGFSPAWLEQCISMKILPLDQEQQQAVAQARLSAPEHLAMFKQLMARPDLQQLASNPLILSMVLSYIRSSAQAQTSGPLNRWKLYHTAMSTIITRLDAKTLEARKGQAGRDSGEYMLMLQEIAFKAHCKQMKDLNSEVLRSAITEQTAALWEDVKESVARGQFAVLTFFVENDETIYRFGHLTFQEHLCSMVINRMLTDEMERVKNIMTASGGIRKMLQGSWWLTVTQFCLEGLMAEGERGEELANRFAECMLEEVIHKEGVLKLTAKELHSFDSMSAFAVLLRHTYKASALELGDGKSELNAEWLPQLCHALNGHPTLRRLTLRRMMINALPAAMADAGLGALSAVLRASTVLEVLQLQSCGLESRHVLPLCSELRASPIRLRELDLSGNKIADGGLVALAQIFEVDGVTLEMLDISGNALEEGGVAAIAKALSASSGLKTVKLANHALPIQELKTGKSVNMDGQKLTDFDLQFMAEVLSAAPRQPSGEDLCISLGYNGLTEKGASMLAKALGTGAMRVQQLNLRGNKVGVDGAVALIEAMMRGGCPLKVLDLSDNGICGLSADGSGRYAAEAVYAVCAWLKTDGNPLRELKLGQNQLCGVNWEGRGHYTSVAVEALCDALVRPSCSLRSLKIFGNCWGNRDTLKLADALRQRTTPLECVDMRWNEMGSDATEALLAAATDACRVEHMPQRLRCGATLNAHTNWVETLQHDEMYMYSGSQDQTIRKWRRSDLHCEAVLKGHEKGVLSLKLLGDMLYAGDRKGEIKLWKVPLIAVDGR